LIDFGRIAYCIDGDKLRSGLNKDLGFSIGQRRENIRRIAEVSKLFNEAGIIVIVAIISPLKEFRENARKTIGTKNFVEIFIDTPLEECERRDPNGLYKKARSGVISNFTGISSPYEAPERPDLVLHTLDFAVAECVQKLVSFKID